MMKFNSIPEILEDIRDGKMVIMLDDEDRENEGDLIMAASLVRPEDINFMAKYGRGLICLPMTRERCQQLNLPLMVNANQTRFSTNFTVSIEAAEGVTTGISAYDRAHTIRTAVKPDAEPLDLSQPGHVFPLKSITGGVLTRAGHTEASVDLAMLASLEPAAVLVEILNEDGSMARQPELRKFASQHGLKIGTIADLIRYRMENEITIKRLNEQMVDTEFGKFKLVAYRDLFEKKLHMAMVLGEIDSEEPFLVRVHVRHQLGDVLGIQDAKFGLPLRTAMQAIASNGSGLLLVLGGDESDEDILHHLEQREPPKIATTGDNRSAQELRTYGVGAQIIANLGIKKMRVLSAPKRFHGLSEFGLEVVEYVDPPVAGDVSGKRRIG